MRNAFLGLLALLTFTTCALAENYGAKTSALPQLKVLTSDEITRLQDKNLLDAYVDVSVEIEALKSLHATSGYTSEEYQKFKDLIRYRILLLNEVKKRKLEVPVVQ